MEYKKYKLLNFNSVYKSKGYPRKIWPILNEYFSRYKYEFDLSDKEIQKKLSIIINNLDNIEIGGNAEDSHIGTYDVSKKLININIEKIKQLNIGEDDIFCAIFHELNHASENSNYENNTSFEQYNQNTFSFDGTSLNEIITEMKASRLAKNDRVDLLSKSGDDRNYLELNGYGDLIFIGTMIHTALGISEKEFLKYADMGKESFDNLMATKFPNPDDYFIFMDHINYHSDLLYSIKYNREPNSTYTEDEIDNMYCSISEIYENCIHIMEKVVPYQAYINNKNIDMQKYITKCKFDIAKLKINFKHGLSHILDPESIIDYPDSSNLQYKIMAIEALENAKHQLGNDEYSNLLFNLSTTDLMGLQYLDYLYNNYGIEPDQESSSFDRTMDLSYQTQILNEEYGQASWNNKKCKKYITNFLKEDNIFTKWFNKLKNISKNNSYDSLPPANDSYENYNISQNNELESLKNLVVDEPYYDEQTQGEEERNITMELEEI